MVKPIARCGPPRNRQVMTERSSAASLERWQRLKRDWNRQVEQAGEQGIHVIYTKGFGDLHRFLSSMAAPRNARTIFGTSQLARIG